MMTLDRETENWEEDFRDFLKQNKEKEKLSDQRSEIRACVVSGNF